MAKCYVALKDPGKATENFEKSLEHSKNLKVYYNLSQVYKSE